MRCILIVLDSAGVGALPDASKFGDKGCNTLGNIAKTRGGLRLENLQKLGLGNIAAIQGVKPVKKPLAAFGKCKEVSAGKDTMTGHWEMMGIKLEKSFPTYPNGFPPSLVKSFEKAIKRKTIGNKPASGTEIIAELGEKHLKTGSVIIYTSTDSVFQIAAHTEKIKVNELYDICKIGKKMLVDKNLVARVIARPFVGKAGAFKRTAQRKDFTISPPRNVLDCLIEADIDVIGIGKIRDIFAGRGVNKSLHGANNDELIKLTINEYKNMKNGLLFINLSDFDTLWGHRNNVAGYQKALEEFDLQLKEVLKVLAKDDLLIITADHGCDPTMPGTDHSREYIPLLVVGGKVKAGKNLKIRDTFADIGRTIADYFNVQGVGFGKSFL